jgi:hypothetical protein
MFCVSRAVMMFFNNLFALAVVLNGPLDRLKESRFYSGDGTLMRKDVYRYSEAGYRVEQQSQFFRSMHLRKSVMTYEFDSAGNWTKETIQRWTEKNGAFSLTETVVSRERRITYY